MDPVLQAKQCKRLRGASGRELCKRAAGRTREYGLRKKGGNRMERDGGVQVWITEGRKGRSGNGAKQNQRKGLTTQSGRKTRTRFTEEEEEEEKEEEDEDEDEEKETLSPTSSRVCTTTTAAVYRQTVPLAS
ncbi:hypothetical protein NDA18_005105 [Ustilago nuda]|nr:hypothetical protein NDA18_005105 [Ustilago nuda]